MCRQIDIHLGTAVSYQLPDGGMSVWIKFADQHSVGRIAARLQGISFHPNIIFDQGNDMNHLRLGFASLNFAEIDVCIASLKQAMTD